MGRQRMALLANFEKKSFFAIRGTATVLRRTTLGAVTKSSKTDQFLNCECGRVCDLNQLDLSSVEL